MSLVLMLSSAVLITAFDGDEQENIVTAFDGNEQIDGGNIDTAIDALPDNMQAQSVTPDTSISALTLSDTPDATAEADASGEIVVYGVMAGPLMGIMPLAATINTLLDFTGNHQTEDKIVSEGWAWDLSSKTLTLKGLDLNTTVSNADAITLPDGATVILQDENKITPNSNYYGINSTGSLTIQDTGISANDGVSISSGKTGIYANGSVTINSCNVSIEADENGIYSETGDVTIDSGDKSININEVTHGIYAKNGNVIINGGMVMVYAGNHATDTGGILADKGNVIINASSSYRPFVSIEDATNGIYAKDGNVTISEGDVHVGGATNGILADKGNVTISGGNIGIYVGNAAGIQANNGSITISGGSGIISGGMGVPDILAAATAKSIKTLNITILGYGGDKDDNDIFDDDEYDIPATYRTLNFNGVPLATFVKAEDTGVLLENIYFKDGVAHSLTVVKGTGGGSYMEYELANIEAEPAPTGMVFDKWTGGNGGTFDDADSASTTFTMPSNDATVTATYKDGEATVYLLSVENGTGGGSYAAGTRVSITAGAAPVGKVFDRWTGGNGGTFDDADSASTTFTIAEPTVRFHQTLPRRPLETLLITPLKPWMAAGL